MKTNRKPVAWVDSNDLKQMIDKEWNSAIVHSYAISEEYQPLYKQQFTDAEIERIRDALGTGLELADSMFTVEHVEFDGINDVINKIFCDEIHSAINLLNERMK